MSVCLCVTMCLVLHVYVGVEPLIKTPNGAEEVSLLQYIRTCIWGGKVFSFDHAFSIMPLFLLYTFVRSKSDDVIPVLAYGLNSGCPCRGFLLYIHTFVSLANVAVY